MSSSEDLDGHIWTYDSTKGTSYTVVFIIKNGQPDTSLIHSVTGADFSLRTDTDAKFTSFTPIRVDRDLPFEFFSFHLMSQRPSSFVRILYPCESPLCSGAAYDDDIEG